MTCVTARRRSGVLRGACGLEPLEGRRMLSAAVWEVFGDGRPKQKGDVIRVELTPSDSTRVRAVVNGKVVGTRALSNVSTIRVLSGAGDDVVTVDVGVGVRAVVMAGTGNDSVTVVGARAQLQGGPGDDTLAGADGNDYIDGGAGNDLLQGNGGLDTLLGGEGNDVLAGGVGRDRLIAGNGEDRAHGGSNADSIQGGAGVDTLFGGTGQDTLSPGAGRDKVYKDRRRGVDKVRDDDGDVTMGDPATEEAFRQFSGESEFERWLIDAAVRRWQELLGQVPKPWSYDWEGLPPVFVTGGAPQAAPGGGVVARDHSNTNTQVDGVDEADRVETDGIYLYTAVGRELVIVSTDPADAMEVVSRTDVGGYISGLYLSADGRLTVLASEYGYAYGAAASARVGMVAEDMWWGGESKTIVATYDVADAAAPVVTEKSVLDGTLTDSRSVDGRVYAIVSNNLWLPGPEIVGEGDERRYESEAEYRERLEAVVAGREMPQFTTEGAGGVTRAGSLVSAKDTYVSGDVAETQTLTSVVLIDAGVGEAGPDATATVVGPSGTVYASAESLYVTGWDWDEETGVTRTNLAKFALGEDSVSLAAVGGVQGSVKDQFSMGENMQGDLNVATTSGWGNASSNNVFTMRESGTRLEVAGAILNVAPGERIFSSRFMGDKGYLVTFRQVDPLFTLDLSDPEDPRVVGELKIPGFSSYLHPIEDGYVLGLGRSGDEEGRVGGLQLSLFDVRDPANPVRVASYSFSGGRSSGSAAEYDHHAIQYFAEQKTLVLPVWNYDEESGEYVEGMAVVEVDTQGGFEQVGFVEQQGAARAVRIEETLYTVGSDTVVASDLNDPGNVFGTVQISNDDDADMWDDVVPVLV